MKPHILQEFSFYYYSGIEISFSLRTKEMSLESLTELLQLEPTRGWTHGEKFMSKQLNTDTNKVEPIERERTSTHFVYETRDQIHSDKFTDHAEHLLRKLEPVKKQLTELLAQPDVYDLAICIYLKFEAGQDYFGFYADAKTLTRLAECCRMIEWRNKT
jgi:hypothetical protein